MEYKSGHRIANTTILRRIITALLDEKRPITYTEIYQAVNHHIGLKDALAFLLYVNVIQKVNVNHKYRGPMYGYQINEEWRKL